MEYDIRNDIKVCDSDEKAENTGETKNISESDPVCEQAGTEQPERNTETGTRRNPLRIK